MMPSLLDEARDPNTSGERLSAIAFRDPEISRAAAMNPSATPWTLERLCQSDYGAYVLQNPVLPTLLGKEHRWFRKLTEKAKQRIVKHDMPQPWLEELARGQNVPHGFSALLPEASADELWDGLLYGCDGVWTRVLHRKDLDRKARNHRLTQVLRRLRSLECWKELRTTHAPSLLHAAAIHGWTSVIEALSGLGINFSWQTEETPLIAAVIEKQHAAVRALLAGGADPNQPGNRILALPLHRAAERNDVESARILLDAGASVHAQDICYRVALTDAAAAGCLEMVQFLLSRGASVDEIDEFCITPAYGAHASGKKEVIFELEKHGASKGPALIACCLRNDLDGVKQQLQQGADPNEVGFAKKTALHWAVMDRNVALVECLLAAGASNTVTNSYFMTPLECAQRAGYDEIVRLLEPSKP